MSLEHELDWLYSTQLFGIKLGLEGISHLLRSCGVDTVAPHVRVIHVAGTNGKGSTCAMLERMGRELGYRTGFFSSPHLYRFAERMRVDGELLPDAQLARQLRQLRERVTAWQDRPVPTFFELVFALALLCFQEAGCDLLILETGMGGRLDATNALAKDVAVITPIGLDHTQYLGDTLSAIAAEKAGIIQADCPIFSAVQDEEAAAVIRARSAELHAPCHFVTTALPADWELSLAGQHQRENAALALAALRQLPEIESRWDEAALRHALADVHWAGRFERIDNRGKADLILDGAHNAHAMRVLVETWQQQMGAAGAACLFAASADKELEPAVRLLDSIVEEWILPPVNSPRIMEREQLANQLREWSKKPVRTVDSLRQGLEELREQHREQLACGSFFLVGEIHALLAEESYRASTQ